MKALRFFCFLTLGTLLMAADCSNKDSEFYNDVFVSVPNLLTVSQSLIPESQDVFVKANIARLLTVSTLDKPLDIFNTTGGATKLVFSFELEKETAPGNWEFFEFTAANIVQTKGESETGSFVVSKAIYDSVSDQYLYEAAITALSPGKYRLSFGYNSVSTNLVEFRSESVNNNLFFNLDSPVSFLDGGGYYNFIIN